MILISVRLRVYNMLQMEVQGASKFILKYKHHKHYKQRQY